MVNKINTRESRIQTAQLLRRSFRASRWKQGYPWNVEGAAPGEMSREIVPKEFINFL